jgi:hypothetical protein
LLYARVDIMRIPPAKRLSGLSDRAVLVLAQCPRAGSFADAIMRAASSGDENLSSESPVFPFVPSGWYQRSVLA